MQVNVIGTLMFVISIAIVLAGEARSRARTRALRELAVMPTPATGSSHVAVLRLPTPSSR